MSISERDLMRMATAYVEDGVLKKWRHDNSNLDHIDSKLNYKDGEALTSDEIAYVKTFPNVVIVTERHVQFINFSGFATRFGGMKQC